MTIARSKSLYGDEAEVSDVDPSEVDVSEALLSVVVPPELSATVAGSLVADGSLVDDGSLAVVDSPLVWAVVVCSDVESVSGSTVSVGSAIGVSCGGGVVVCEVGATVVTATVRELPGGAVGSVGNVPGWSFSTMALI